jgi:hypothetical protein
VSQEDHSDNPETQLVNESPTEALVDTSKNDIHDSMSTVQTSSKDNQPQSVDVLSKSEQMKARLAAMRAKLKR